MKLISSGGHEQTGTMLHLHTGIWKAGKNSLKRGWKGVNVSPLRHHTKSAEAQSDSDTNTLSKSSLSTEQPSASLATQSLLHFKALKWSFREKLLSCSSPSTSPLMQD